jgi:hypothetical protein
MAPIERILEALRAHGYEPRRSGNGWSARCPAHDDRRASLSISTGDDGTVLMRCHAGCSVTAICDAVGIELRDLFNGTSNKTQTNGQRKRIVARYDYTDEQGKLLYQAVRYEPKDFRQRKPDGNGGWAWKLDDVRRVPYRLPELLAADPDQWVFVVEGEKDVENLWRLGLVATTNAGGAGKWRGEYSKSLRARKVCILPDNDKPGRDHAQHVLKSLRGIARETRIVKLPDLPDKGDVSDWLAGGGTAEKLMAQLYNAPVAQTENSTPTLSPQFEPFPVNALPDVVRRFVTTAAKAIGCDPSFVAVPMLSGLAAAIGNTRRIELRRGWWSEPAVVWTAIVGDSGTLKSPALDTALRAIREREAEAVRVHAEAMLAHQQEALEYERELARWKRSKTDGEPPKQPTEPVCERRYCSDITVEAIADRLSDAPRGLLLIRDELAGWLKSFDAYKGGRGGDSAHWLSMHGARDLIVDRKAGDKSKRTIRAPHAAVSITGGIQPGVLRAALSCEHFEDGLSARLLVAMPPRRAKRWIEAEIDPEIQTEIANLFGKLWELQPDEDGHGEPRPRIVRLTPEAKEAWIEFYNDHAREQAELTGDLSAAWSKLEGYAARLALVVHCVRWAAHDGTITNPDLVDAGSIAAGVRLSRWFGQEARRVYAVLGESDEDREQRRLVELIERKGGQVSVRDVMRSSRLYTTADDAEQALDELVKQAIAARDPIGSTPRGGQPHVVYRLVDTVDVDTTPTNTGTDVVLSMSTVSTEGNHTPTDDPNEEVEWTG